MFNMMIPLVFAIIAIIINVVLYTNAIRQEKRKTDVSFLVIRLTITKHTYFISITKIMQWYI